MRQLNKVVRLEVLLPMILGQLSQMSTTSIKGKVDHMTLMMEISKVLSATTPT